jgi:hypothetical protein
VAILLLQHDSAHGPDAAPSAPLAPELCALLEEFTALTMHALLWDAPKFGVLASTDLDAQRALTAAPPRQHWLRCLARMRCSEQQLEVLHTVFRSVVDKRMAAAASGIEQLAGQGAAGAARLASQLQQDQAEILTTLRAAGPPAQQGGAARAQPRQQQQQQQQQAPPAAATSAAVAGAGGGAAAAPRACGSASPQGRSSGRTNGSASPPAPAATGGAAAAGRSAALFSALHPVVGPLHTATAAAGAAAANGTTGAASARELHAARQQQTDVVNHQTSLLRQWRLQGLCLAIVTASTLTLYQQVRGRTCIHMHAATRRCTRVAGSCLQCARAGAPLAAACACCACSWCVLLVCRCHSAPRTHTHTHTHTHRRCSSCRPTPPSP